jgi:predicted SprT family Zn-dependent metalloprotease
MKIPKEFKLFGQTIKIKYVDRLVDGEDSTGQARYREGIILIQKNNKGIHRNKEQVEQTFLHELVHYILQKMGKHDLQNNEEFVDVFAGLLHQALTTMK